MSAQDEAGAYACAPGDERAACPPATAIAGLEEELEALDVLAEVEQMAWACLRTGSHERHCIKDLGLAAPEPGPADPVDPGPADEPADPGPSEIPGDPTPPSDCDPQSWEPYFCQLSTAKYRQNGVDITFPCDIFDAAASLQSTLDDVPQATGDSGLPSCHDGEWQMREQAWLDAVTRGCLQLNDPILVMCQQAANHAPSSGACSPTGTW